MTFIPATDPATQLVTLHLESETTHTYEGIRATLTEVVPITGTVDDVDEITGVVVECDG